MTSLVVLLAIAPSAGSQPPRMAARDFPIFAWNTTRGDRSVYRDIYDCGFNVAGFVQPAELDMVAAAGLQAFVYDPKIPVRLDGKTTESLVNEQVLALTSRFGSHPAVFGYYLADEPSAAVFSQLAMWTKALRAVVPHQVAYVNCLPNYATPEQLGTENYLRYLEAFLEKTAQPSFSYSHYALMDNGALRDGYYQNLEAVKKAAARHGITFWNVVLSTACLDYAEPSEAGLRFQAFSSLAYGVRGIGWFTYFTPAIGSFRDAPVDAFGQRTPTWDMLRRVNLQLHRLGPVYLTWTSQNVFHHPQIPDGCRGLDKSIYLQALSGGQFVVGEFKDQQGQPCVLIVNCNLTRAARFELKPKINAAPWFLSAITGEAAPLTSEHTWLAPGQGALLMFARKNVPPTTAAP